jgi:hypothetical protein
MLNRWAIWIDIEGFSNIFKRNETQAIRALGELMEALYRIGSSIFSKDGERLFIHQFGDGFVIVSDFTENSPDRPIAICISLMRHLLSKGFVSKSSISTGSFSDISSCYPQEVLDASQDRRHIKLGRGIMTILPVMGTALVAAHKLANKRRGSVLIFDSSLFSDLLDQVIISSGEPVSVDWIHSNPKIICEICEKANLKYLKPEIAEELMKIHINENRSHLPVGWIASTEEALSLQQ